jgi:hypothetical protein
MKGRTAPWTTAGLAIVCAGLGVIVAFELTGGLSLAPEVTAAPPGTPEVAWSHQPIAFAPPSRDQIEETVARPLFSPSRRPFVADEVEEAPEPVQALPSLQLIGVLVTEQQRAALMQHDGGDPSWVREGSDLGGWEIEKIEHSRVKVRAGDRLDTVDLRPDTTVPADARPQPRRARTDRRQEAASDEDDGGSEADGDPPIDEDEEFSDEDEEFADEDEEQTH